MDSAQLQPGQSATIDLQKEEGARMLPTDARQKALRLLVTRRHPEFECTRHHWAFCEDTYEGGREWFTPANLFRYIREGDQEFRDRLQRAYRFNHTREVVDLIIKYLFKMNIVRKEDDASDAVKRFWNKATKDGLSFDEFMRGAGRRTAITGRQAIVVDNPPAPDGAAPLSVADAKQLKIEPYAYMVGPQQILDYDKDERGELNWITILEVRRDSGDPFTSSGEQFQVYRLWTRFDWRLFRKVLRKNGQFFVEEIGFGYHGLGEVPVVLAPHIISDDEYAPPGMVDDIVYLDRAAANYLSNLDQIVQDQSFSQLAMPAQNLLPDEEASDKVKEMGTKRIFLYDGEGGGKPEYLSPDPRQAHLIVEVVNKIISEIYHSIGLAGERTKQDNAMGIDNSSGVAKAFDFERVNALLAAKADAMEMIENKVTRLVQLWAGEKPADGEAKELIEYPDDFDTRGLYDEFDISARLLLVQAPDKIRRKQMEQVVDKLFPQIGEATRKELIASLSTWPIPLEQQLQMQGGVGTSSRQTIKDQTPKAPAKKPSQGSNQKTK